MKLTGIRITLRNEEKLKAFVGATFDDCFVVHNIKIVRGKEGLLLCMPTRKTPSGAMRDIAHPVHSQFRAYLEGEIFSAYEKELAVEELRHLQSTAA